MNFRGIITLTFDDGYSKVIEIALPLLTQYNFPAVFSIPLEPEKLAMETHQSLTPWQQWVQVASDAGHEIAAHSISHTDLTKLSPSELERQITKPAQTLNAHTIAYPGGAHNENVVDLARQHYRAGRTLLRGFNQLPPADPLRLQTFNYGRRNFSPLKANLRVLYAWLTNSWLIETFHLIDDNLPIEHSVRLSDFKQHLKFISHLPIQVKTIKQVIS